MQKTFKEIQEEIEALPCLRPEKELMDRDEAPVVCHVSEVAETADYYRGKLHRLPPLYLVAEEEAPDIENASKNVLSYPVKFLPPDAMPHVFFKPARAPRLTRFGRITESLRKMGFGIWTVETCSVAQFWGRNPCVFSMDDLAKIGVIYNRLSDQASKATYLAAIKSRLTGQAGYIPRSPYPQYSHPEVQPAPGDHVCEGGVDNGISTEQIAAWVTEQGYVHGFEPVPESYVKGREYLAPFPQISLINKALWSHSGTMPFSVQPGSHCSARIRQEGNSTCLCESIDEYFRDKRLDMIKLDVEGAESQVLAGAAQSLIRHKPKLSICIYHNAGRDLVDVPWLLLQSSDHIHAYIGHHTYWFNETVLYARWV